MATLQCSTDGLKLINPFLVASGPPAGNKAVIMSYLKAGWAGVVPKTISPDSVEIQNVSPRYALKRGSDGTVTAAENIELISTLPLSEWLDITKAVKDSYPERVFIASIMAPMHADEWQSLIYALEKVGADGFELNGSCPHGMSERGMGQAIGDDPQAVAKICTWAREATERPLWFKITPNADCRAQAEAAFRGGASGVTAINTVNSLWPISFSQSKLLPRPNVGGYTTQGGLSGGAILSIALAKIATCRKLIDESFPGRTISGVGGIQSAEDAANHLVFGAESVQLCTAPMYRKNGPGMIAELCDGLLEIMEQHGWDSPRAMSGACIDMVLGFGELLQHFRHTHPRRLTGDDQLDPDRAASQAEELADA